MYALYNIFTKIYLLKVFTWSVFHAAISKSYVEIFDFRITSCFFTCFYQFKSVASQGKWVILIESVLSACHCLVENIKCISFIKLNSTTIQMVEEL